MDKKIFISYSDSDRSKMRSLEKIINKTDHFTPVIIADRRTAFQSLTDKVKTGIYESEYFLPILTKNSISSQWVNQEIGYAVAFEKEIFPIVEQQIINELKGFIHKNIDLPYSFSEKENPKSSHGAFRKVCDIVINDLLITNNYIPKSIELEAYFPGKWKSTFKSSHISGAEAIIEIKDGNKYLVNGKHCFNIEKVELDIVNSRLSFMKVGLSKDNRRFTNALHIEQLGAMYKGYEEEKLEKLPIQIVYQRIK